MINFPSCGLWLELLAHLELVEFADSLDIAGSRDCNSAFLCFRVQLLKLWYKIVCNQPVDIFSPFSKWRSQNQTSPVYSGYCRFSTSWTKVLPQCFFLNVFCIHVAPTSTIFASFYCVDSPVFLKRPSLQW